MATSKDELARALEAMSSGQAAAQPEPQEQPPAPPTPVHRAEPPQPEPTPAARVSRAIRPLPGKPVAPALRSTHGQPGNDRGLNLRRTIIPPLLTLGTLLPFMGVVSLVMGEESPLGEQPLVPTLLILVGVLVLGIAALNMLQVRHLLSASAKR